MGEFTFIRPTGGYISSVFGEKRKKKDKKTGKIIHYTHKGIDYAARRGTTVEASESGVVLAADTNIPGYGNLIIIDHAPNARDNERHIYTLYAHLDTIGARRGEIVNKGQKIGTVGHSGYAYSKSGKDPSHLHFEVIDYPGKASRTDILSKEGRARGYRKDPIIEGTVDDFLGEEMEKLYDMIGTDFRTTPKPVLSIDVPKFKDFLRSIGRRSYQGTPPKVKLDFENNFSKEFRSFFPTLELEVNGKSLGRVRTGQKIYELDIWR
jgi:murein DD-endopeptidase MepM/ murein hydrolase activator NlpD